MADGPKLYALVDYQDPYVQPLILAALQDRLPSGVLVLIHDISQVPSPSVKLLQWRQYESIDFENLMSNKSSSLANSYIIRKALIRKHYLSTTVSHWLTKHPKSVLKNHVKPSIEFEVDYAEFLDDALLEAFELKESWARNATFDESSPDREWWILKPGMSDRGQGIRLFSSEEELNNIFAAWDPLSDNEDDDDDSPSGDGVHEEKISLEDGVMASHLRHFVAQPYIEPPLLIPSPHPSANRKFHIRAYVLATGALQVYVYKPMLALFAGKPYTGPSVIAYPNDDLSRHLTNTCLQDGEREGSVHAFWSLPHAVSTIQKENWQEDVFQQICTVTGQVFEAAARSMSIHFQPLPNAFELFGLDFLVDAQGTAWLLEVNAFPDFGQTGSELQEIICDLFRETVELVVKPFLDPDKGTAGEKILNMRQVLNIDLGRK